MVLVLLLCNVVSLICILLYLFYFGNLLELRITIIYREQELNKCYIALFACASSRVIHLKLAPNLTAKSFIRAFKRFIGWRGVPCLVISENGKTFRDSKVKNFVTSMRVRTLSCLGGGGTVSICPSACI